MILSSNIFTPTSSWILANYANPSIQKSKTRSPAFLLFLRSGPHRPRWRCKNFKANIPFHHTDTSFLDDTTKILTYQKLQTGRLHYAQRYAYITLRLRSTHAFVKSKLEATPYVSTNVIDWNISLVINSGFPCLSG